MMYLLKLKNLRITFKNNCFKLTLPYDSENFSTPKQTPKL